MNGNARPSVDPDYVQGLDGVAGGEVLEDAGEEGGEAVADAAGGPQVLLREGAVPGAEDEGPVPPPNQPAQGREEGRGVEDDPLGRQGSSPRHLEGGEGDPVEGGVDGAGVPPQQDRPLGGCTALDVLHSTERCPFISDFTKHYQWCHMSHSSGVAGLLMRQ